MQNQHIANAHTQYGCVCMFVYSMFLTYFLAPDPKAYCSNQSVLN